MLIRISLILLCLISSGVVTEKQYDPSLFKYIKAFEQDFNRTITYPVSFFTENSTIMGKCSYFKTPIGRFFSKVEFNTKYWNTMDEKAKVLLAYHEFGHCTLELDHDDSEFSDYCPIKNMHSYNIPDVCINKYGIDFYINSMRLK